MNRPFKDPIAQTIAGLNLKVAELRSETDAIATFHTSTAGNTEKVLELLHRSEALEQQYLDWYKTRPASWQVKTVAWVDSIDVHDLLMAEVYPGRVHSYRELF